MTVTKTRRAVLKSVSATATVLTIGVNTNGVLASQAAQAPHFSPFLTIDTQGVVTAVIKHFEGGQGVSTGLSALIAEELNMSLDDINWVTAPADAARYGNAFFGGAQLTGGSTAMPTSYIPYRTAGAAAREVLLQAAAETWEVDVSTLALKDGLISGANKESGIGAFVEKASTMPLPKAPKLKDPSEFMIIGADIRKRRDSADKTNGSAKFSMDVHLSDMMVAAIKRSPRFGGVVASFDDRAAKEMPGFIMAKALPNGAGVVAYADTTWRALKARDALIVEWDNSNAEMRSSDAIEAELSDLVNKDAQWQATSTSAEVANGLIDAATDIIEKEFYLPMLAHAPMEPMGATIEPLENGGVRWHDGAQAPTMNQQIASEILGIPMEKVEVNSLYAGGFFGRRANPAGDYLVELTLAFALTDRARPVKLVWSREDDIKGGYYRAPVAHKVRVGLDNAGKIVGWDHRIATKSIFKGTPFEGLAVHDGIDHFSVEGTADTVYSIPGMHVGLTDHQTPVTTNWWRSVGHSHTGYVMECMMDTCAHAAGTDPVAYRLQYLDMEDADQARLANTIKLAAEKANWGTNLPAGHYRGFAAHKSFGTYVAEICEISVHDGKIKIEQYVAAVDCGIAVTPDVVKAQIEGGIGYGVGHIMRDKITLAEGIPEQSNFYDYEPLRIYDLSHIDVHIAPSTEPPSGIGEPGTPPAGAALANAIVAAGQPLVTHLPMTTSGIRFV